MQKDILVIPDVHCKQKLLDIARKFIEKVDKIVFLGDYVDDWGLPRNPQTGQELCDTPISTDEQMLAVLDGLIAFKRQYLDKVVLLWGNHDWDYLHLCQYGSHSGYRKHLETAVNLKFKENEDLFQLAYWAEVNGRKYLFSHAGLTLSFQRRFSEVFKRCQGENLAETLNNINSSKDRKIFAYLDTNERFIETIEDVYLASQGPLWVRKDIVGDADPKINQVVGHTPVKTVEFVENYLDNRIYFCDTFSTDSVGNKIGDEKLLLISERKDYVVGENWLKANLL